MAYPVVPDAVLEQTTASGTSHAITMPATVDAGDLLIVLVRTTGTINSVPAGWSTLYDVLNTVRGAAYAKLADGTEDGGSATWGTSAAAVLRTHVYRISAGTWAGVIATGVEGTTSTGTASADPNPPSLNPAQWDSEETLWIAHAATSAAASGITSYPSGYTDGVETDFLHFSARIQSTTSAENPGVFDLTGTPVDNVAGTIGIRPYTAPPASVVPNQNNRLSMRPLPLVGPIRVPPAAETATPSRDPQYRSIALQRGPMPLRHRGRPRYRPHVIAEPTLPALTQIGIRIDLYEADGTTKVAAGPVLNALECSYGEQLSQLSGFSFTLPLNDRMASECTRGRIARIFIGGEGYVFQGRIEVIRDEPGERGVKVISGRSVAVELANLSVRFGLTFDETDTFSDVVALFLADTDWVAGSLDSPTLATYSRSVVGVKRFPGLLKVAEMFGWHVRPDGRTRFIDLGAFGENCGLRFTNWEGPVSPRLRENTSLVLLERCSQTTDITDQVKRVIAVGQEQGISGDRLTLELATEGPPFVQSASDYSGPDYHYIEDPDASNVGSEDIITVRDIVQASLSAADQVRAANALWGVAKTYLDRRSAPLQTYAIQPVGLKHIVNGLDTFRVGQKARVQWWGWDIDRRGTKRQYIDIDTDLWLMGYQRRVQSDGRSDWQFSVSSVPREVPTETSMLVDLYERFDSSVTAPRSHFSWGGTPPVGRLTPDGMELIAEDSGDEFASIPNAAFIRWFKDAFGGSPTGEIASGYSTPGVFEFSTAVLRAFIDGFDAANAKVGVWNIASNHWDTLLAIQNLDPALAQLQLSSWIGGVLTPLLALTGSGDDFYLALRRDGALAQLLATGDVSGMNKVTGSGYLVMPAAATGIDPANSGSAWTNGAWSQVLASTSEADSIIGIMYSWDDLVNDTFVEAEIDIGTGAAAAEVAVGTIPAIKQQSVKESGAASADIDNSFDLRPLFFPAPIEIATSTRVAVRVRSSSTTLEPANIRLIYAKAAELVNR